MSRVERATLELVRGLEIDPGYLRRVVTTLSTIGSTPLGFRTTGTPEDAAVAAFVAAEMREMGLDDVAIEPVDVDGWRFLGGFVQVGADTIEACSFGGVPGTPAGGVTGPLRDVGVGRRRQLHTLDLGGAVALLDWRDRGVSPFIVAAELQSRGVVGIVLNCPENGAWWQADDALGSFDGHWFNDGLPMVLVRKEKAAELRTSMSDGSILEATVVLDVERRAHVDGHNVVGYLPGEQPGPIVVGAHHDGWFSGAWDNASGVAVTLAMAKALITAGHRPAYTICFTSRTAEEYGIFDSSYDWCIGAWRQIETTHPEWEAAAPFHLCVEASGRPDLRVIVETSVELSAWARDVCRAAKRQGWLPGGWRIGPPVSGTELWPFLVSGVPSVAAYSWEISYGKTGYHSQFDTADLLDFDLMAGQTRAYLLLLLEAARDPDRIIDHRARAADVEQVAEKLTPRHADLAAAARRHAGAKGRDEFARIGRGLVALDSHGELSYPHAQALADVGHLEASIAAVDAGDPVAARRRLTKVGCHYLFSYLSESVFAAYTQRDDPRSESVARSWASRSHLTPSPNAWAELATLHGERGARADGPWLRESLTAKLESSRRQLDHRLASMARALSPSDLPDEMRST